MFIYYRIHNHKSAGIVLGLLVKCFVNTSSTIASEFVCKVHSIAVMSGKIPCDIQNEASVKLNSQSVKTFNWQTRSRYYRKPKMV